jgi:hypothetical protein
MTDIEVRGMSPEDMIREIETSVKQYKENKYAFQVGLRDVDFDVDEDKVRAAGIRLPFASIAQAELALASGLFSPIRFIENDHTEHVIVGFDPRPVGYSGFMDCVTHSLVMTSLGLFEVGRYAAVDLSAPGRSWQWFLHRRLATVDQVDAWCEQRAVTSMEFLLSAVQAMIDG